MIPKIIHYCWFGGNPLPSDVKQCIKSWKRMCPDYEVICWNEANFDVNAHPFTRDAYKARAWAFVSDFVRLKVVYDNGGIYLDTDVELLKNLDSLLKYECYIGVQQYKLLCTTGLGFGAEKENPIVKKMLDKYDGLIFSDDNKELFACPYLNNEVIKQMGYVYTENPFEIEKTMILPCQYFDPLAPGNESKNLMCSDTISIHHYSASWLDNRTKLRRKIIRSIDPRLVDYIKKIIKRISFGKRE